MKKSLVLDLTQLFEEGVTPHYSYEIFSCSDPSYSLHALDVTDVIFSIGKYSPT